MHVYLSTTVMGSRRSESIDDPCHWISAHRQGIVHSSDYLLSSFDDPAAGSLRPAQASRNLSINVSFPRSRNYLACSTESSLWRMSGDGNTFRRYRSWLCTSQLHHIEIDAPRFWPRTGAARYGDRPWQPIAELSERNTKAVDDDAADGDEPDYHSDSFL